MRTRKVLGSALLFTALSSSVSAQDAPTELRYALWDSAQLPAYQQCAVAFQEGRPDIEIVFEQLGWDDYWTNLTTGFLSETAPDVFVNHLARYPELASFGQLVDLEPLIARDGVDTGVYLEGLAELWTREGARYGLPKDWDTIAVVYNKEMIERAGITEEEMENWTWNPENGGTYQETIARLTLDQNGNNGLSPDFNKRQIAQYGLVYNGTGDATGQTEWSMYAVSTGWAFNNGIWGDSYNYSDPKFIETIGWLERLTNEARLTPLISDVEGLGGSSIFNAGQAAMITDGSWMISQYANNAPFEVGFAKIPAGPEGRKSMFNGLADSIWVGTEHPEEAWAWVKFLASAECQDIVGDAGIVFPAIPSGVDRALEAYRQRGIDATAFTDLVESGDQTFPFPITDFSAQIGSIMNSTMGRIFLAGGDVAQNLTRANEQINALFQQ